MKANKKILFIVISLLFLVNIHGQEKSLLESRSKINWVTKKFISNVNLNVDKANIQMPSGKLTAINRISERVPDLIKDPLLTINVDSNNKLCDLVTQKELTYNKLKTIISSSNATIGYFKKDSSDFTTNHKLELSKIISTMVHHSSTYKLKKPVNYISTKEYTGIIIDARGQIPVHGEFINDEVEPCFFPKIYSDDMELIYEKNMVDASKIKERGICHYDYSDDEKNYSNIIGNQPLRILAQKTFGRNRSDLIIKEEDALKIISLSENLELLKNGKVVILLNKDQLIYDVAAPLKDKAYYTAIEKVKLYIPRERLGPDEIEHGDGGFKFLYNLKFVPNSPELLPEEKPRIVDCAKLLKQALEENSFTIFVEGHTADINQPENQMILSIERTQTIIKALIEEGIPASLFTYRGHGATIPAKGGDNSTPEGRAINRRVEITLRPRQTYIQRAN